MGGQYSGTPGFRADLQGVRALAVTAVVLAHAGIPGFSGGFVGVDVFFVLSGYLITGILFREYRETATIDLLGFYSRRIKRLLPVMALVIGATLAVAFMLFPAAEVKAVSGSSPFASIWLSNVYFSFRGLDYFGEDASEDLFLHTWSLGVEEQFYLVWPFLILFFSFTGRRFLSRSGSSGRSALVFGFIAVFISSFALCAYWLQGQPMHSFYQMPSRAWQFALGAITFLVFSGEQDERKHARGVVAGYGLLLVGMALVLFSVGFYDRKMAYPGLPALVPSLGAVLLISAWHVADLSKNPLSWKPLVWVGDRSYGLYLWHWPALRIIERLEGDLSVTAVILLFAGLLLLSDLSYRFVEKPFWRGPLSHYPAKRVMQSGLAVMLVWLAASFHATRVPPEDDGPAGMAAARLNLEVPVIYGMGCDAWYLHDEVAPCIFRQENDVKTAVVMGDSIGLQWFSLISGVLLERKWRVVVLTKSACPMVDEPYFYTRINRIYTVCESWRNKVLGRLAEWRPDVVIMGSYSGYEFTDEQWISGSQRIWKKINDQGVRVIVIPGTPPLGMNGPNCIRRGLEKGRSRGQVAETCRRDQSADTAFRVSGLLWNAAAASGDVKILDLNRRVCPEGVCRAMTDAGVVVFRDDKHLNDGFVRSLIPEVAPELLALIEAR